MNLKHGKKNKLALLLAFALAFNMSFALLGTSAGAVSNSQINALKQQQSQLAQKKANIQAQSQALKGQVADQTQKLTVLAQQLDVTNQELENLSQQIAAYTDSIAQLENELNVDEQKEQELLTQYGKRMRAMEENGNYSAYIAIIFDADNFQDLLSRIDDIKKIMQHDTDLLNEIRDAKEKVQQAKSNMEAEMATQEEVFQQYQDKQADLLSQQEEVKSVLSTLQANSADYDAQLQSVNALSTSISGQITSMEAELEEQKRIQAEQAAAAQIANSNKNTGKTSSGSSSGSSSSGGSSSKWSNDSTVSGGSGQDIVNYAMQFLGVPYVYGGTSPSGFDCSGLVYYCYHHFGYSVNRTAAGLSYNGTSVSSLRAGDVLLFTSTDGSYIGHTGIYIGSGQFIHAPHTGDVVKISNLSDSYYTSHYVGARRIAG